MKPGRVSKISSAGLADQGSRTGKVSGNTMRSVLVPHCVVLELTIVQWTLKAWIGNKDLDKKSPFPNLIKVMISAGVPTQTALSEAKENLGPGTDTTSASLAHILYALSRNPVYQQKLYEDTAALGFPTDMSSLESIPRLRACVKEGIRWAGAAAAMLPRVVPQGGAELCGKFIPEGVSFPHARVFTNYTFCSLTTQCYLLRPS